MSSWLLCSNYCQPNDFERCPAPSPRCQCSPEPPESSQGEGSKPATLRPQSLSWPKAWNASDIGPQRATRLCQGQQAFPPNRNPEKPGLNHSWLTKISIHRWHSLLSVCLDASMVAYHYNIICPCLIPALSRTLIRLQQPKHTELRTPRPLQVKHKTYSQVLSLFVLCYTNQRVLLCVNAFLVLSWQGLCLLNQPPSPARIANSVI